MTDTQRKALQDFVLLSQANAELTRMAERLCRVAKEVRPFLDISYIDTMRLDTIQATSSDVHDEAERALDEVLKAFRE